MSILFVQNFMMNFISLLTTINLKKKASFGHAGEVSLSVVSTNIKTLEIFSLVVEKRVKTGTKPAR